MNRRPSSMFRGSELPRWLFLVAVVLAGWPMVVLFARPRADDAPTPRLLTAVEIKPVVPDDGVEFLALTDKTAIQARESAAYAELLRRARETSARKLADAARKDILYTHLWERPERYRGVPVHIEGTAKRVLTYEVNPGLAPKGRLFEAWIYSDENRVVPYVVIFEDPPPGLAIGPDLFVRIRFDGYFMKLLRYTAADHVRAAPMLVGRLSIARPPAEATAPMVEVRNFARRDGFVIVFVLLLGYIALRAFLLVRKALLPTRPTPPTTARGLEPPADEVAEWLRGLPEEPDNPPPRDDSDFHPGGSRDNPGRDARTPPEIDRP